MKSPIVILLIANQLSAWKIEPLKPAQRLQIQGELILKVTSQDGLIEAYSDLIERLRGDGYCLNEVHWIIDNTCRSLWLAYQAKPNQAGNTAVIWQCFSWEWLAERFGFSIDIDLSSPNQIENQLLPWLVALDNSIEQQHKKAALENEHQNESERLAFERLQLQRENEHLQAQNAALQQIDAERLASFLPALFARVFTVLGAADLALLCGRVEPLSIPNPYPEPSEETLRTLQKHFRALPRELQVQIVRFVAQLPQRQKLSPRSEMRELISELEGANNG